MFDEPKKDGFETEAPSRAFTTFDETEMYAVGKGFRPSVQHLPTYLTALEQKEYWRLVQVLDPGGGDTKATLTMLFRRHLPPLVYIESPQDMTPAVDATEVTSEDEGRAASPDDIYAALARVLDKPMSTVRRDMNAIMYADYGMEPTTLADYSKAIESVPEYKGPPTIAFDDPVNPKHYAGTACADIGERLTANCYQVLKYCWRLGKKDDAKIELGKALWYLDREMNDQMRPVPVNREGGTTYPMGGKSTWFGFVTERVAGQSKLVQNLGNALSRWSFEGDGAYLNIAHEAIQNELDELNQG